MKDRIYKLWLYFQFLSETMVIVDKKSGKEFLTFWRSQKAFQTLFHMATLFCNGQN